MLQNETTFLDILGELGSASIDAWASREVARIQQPSVRNIAAAESGLFSAFGGGGAGGGMLLLIGAVIIGAVIISR